MPGGAEPIAVLGELVDPVKIDGLDGERTSNPRLRKVIYWLETAKRSGRDPEAVVLNAQRRAGASVLKPSVAFVWLAKVVFRPKMLRQITPDQLGLSVVSSSFQLSQEMRPRRNIALVDGA